MKVLLIAGLFAGIAISAASAEMAAEQSEIGAAITLACISMLMIIEAITFHYVWKTK